MSGSINGDGGVPTYINNWPVPWEMPNSSSYLKQTEVQAMRYLVFVSFGLSAPVEPVPGHNEIVAFGMISCEVIDPGTGLGRAGQMYWSTRSRVYPPRGTPT
jgi:hypothetical protein